MSRKSMSRKSVSRKSVSRKSVARKSKVGGGGRRKSVKSTADRGSHKSVAREDKKPSVEVPYTPVILNVANIHPFFLLLRCSERSIVLKALNYIWKHIKYNFEDVELMYQRTYMEDVKELAQVKEKYIPDAALRLLGLISKDKKSHKYVTSDDEFIRFLFDELKTKETNAKYSSQILANVTEDVDFVKKITADGSGYDMKIFIDNLSHSIPDVCHYTLKVIGNIFHDIYCAEKFVNLKDFSFIPLFNSLEKPYIEIQKKALTLIEWLGCQKKTNELKDRFFEQKGVDRMFGVLMNFQWRDLHSQVLDVLRVYLEVNEDRIRSLERAGIGKFVNYIDFIEDDTLIAKVLGNILDIATTVFGKVELVELGFVSKVTSMLSDGTVEMKLEACNIINEMVKNIETVRMFTELAPIPELVDILTDRDYSWELWGAALGVLHNLTKFSADMAFFFSKEPAKSKFKDWVYEFLLGIPHKYKNVLYDLFSVLVQHPLVRPDILEFPLLWVFHLGLRDTSPKMAHVQTVSAEALLHIIPQEPYARQFIVAVEGMDLVARALIRAQDRTLIEMLCNVVRIAAENDEFMLISLLRLRVLDWLVKKIRMWTDIEAMEWAATALQNRFLPAKFEYRGRLTFNDITQNGFYIRREYDKPENLPIPPSKTDESSRVPYTVYIANFILNKDRVTPAKIREKFREKVKQDEALDQKCVKSYGMTFADASEGSAAYDLWDDPLYLRKCKENSVVLQDDLRLISFYDELVKRLEEADESAGVRDYSMPFDHSWVLSRVEAIVDIVTKAMGGNSEDRCRNHTMVLYLDEMKVEKKTRLLPLGALEMGGSLERALLFKVLADKVGLPCSLWRGAHGNGWNEIALLNLGAEFPMRNKEETKVKTEDKAEMPTRLMYPTHIVDLIERPGRLLEVGSTEAEHYIGRPIQSVLNKVPESTNLPLINTCLFEKQEED